MSSNFILFATLEACVCRCNHSSNSYFSPWMDTWWPRQCHQLFQTLQEVQWSIQVHCLILLRLRHRQLFHLHRSLIWVCIYYYIIVIIIIINYELRFRIVPILIIASVQNIYSINSIKFIIDRKFENKVMLRICKDTWKYLIDFLINIQNLRLCFLMRID